MADIERRICLSNTQYRSAGGGFIIEAMQAGNWSYRILVVSLAGRGHWSTARYLFIPYSLYIYIFIHSFILYINSFIHSFCIYSFGVIPLFLHSIQFVYIYIFIPTFLLYKLIYSFLLYIQISTILGPDSRSKVSKHTTIFILSFF